MSRTADRVGTKSKVRKQCQGRTGGIIPRVQRQFMRIKLVPVLTAAQIDALKDATQEGNPPGEAE